MRATYRAYTVWLKLFSPAGPHIVASAVALYSDIIERRRHRPTDGGATTWFLAVGGIAFGPRHPDVNITVISQRGDHDRSCSETLWELCLSCGLIRGVLRVDRGVLKTLQNKKLIELVMWCRSVSNNPNLADAVVAGLLSSTRLSTHSRLTAICSGLPGWAGTRRNIHPLTPILGHGSTTTTTTSMQQPLFQDKLGKLVPERYHQSGLNSARDDGVLGCSGICWTICKQSAPRSWQITTPTPTSSLNRLDALPDAQPTVSEQGRRNAR